MGRILTRNAKLPSHTHSEKDQGGKKCSGMIYGVRFLKKKISLAKQAVVVNEQACPCSNICRVARVFVLS